ncbi:serine-rich coiled-coil domain-containing protein 2 isoform X1 [Denticeps clupeoides]|nr:serine-rich coiled-coil domain-containing protein 2-like isoform X1 [Denticeps clupeoides]XP_028821434.1 serine-rich coiled-coil domain-containing protein 2-like isoform X1 [Denticeps clupeoides]XP_028821435.1 serine-rich coiled-coil domain-containing protein 2-like isoform X1 [Denticeps clupeoides]
MEEKTLKQPPMVSKLPKFTSRPLGPNGPISNGSVPMVPSDGGKATPQSRQNGGICKPSSLALRFKKAKTVAVDKEAGLEHQGEEGRATDLRPQKSPVTMREIKKPANHLINGRRPASAVLSSRTIPQYSSPEFHSAAPRHHVTRQSQCNGSTAVNGMGSGPDLSPASTISSLSRSSDSLKSQSSDHIVRSQSFTHVGRPATPTSPPMTRSFSFNSTTKMVKELPRPLAKSPLSKTPLSSPLPVGGKDGKGGLPRPSVGTSRILPPSNLKKFLLPSFASGKTSTLSYKMNRPSLIKKPCSFQVSKVQGDQNLDKYKKVADVEKTTTSPIRSPIEEPGETVIEVEENTPELFGLVSESDLPELRVTGVRGEVLEDMSVSSTSSLEHNDTSEEYMDDFDNLGNGGGILLMSAHEDGHVQSDLHPDNNMGRPRETSSVTSLHSFLSESVDWVEMGLTGDREGFGIQVSTDSDFPHGCSLDLSPSDSSGGTYMWDEEGLEPLGTNTHPCGSYDSDLNSMDILNNLENLESCDLEDDDLMLDVDLAEDASFNSDADGGSHSESVVWSSQWRRRQPIWGRQDPLHNNNRSGILQSCESVQGQGTTRLDEQTLQHMAEDCSHVKDQLLQLITLLEVQDVCSVDDTSSSDACSPDSSDDVNCDQQVQVLLKEVQKLREELRNKDQLISQLQQQMAVPGDNGGCRCQQGVAVRSCEEGLALHDKTTQTPWGGPAPQILQPSRPLQSKNLTQGRLARPVGSTSAGVRPPKPPFSQNPAAQHPAPTASDAASATPATDTSSEVHLSCPDEFKLRLNHLHIGDTDAGSGNKSQQTLVTGLRKEPNSSPYNLQRDVPPASGLVGPKFGERGASRIGLWAAQTMQTRTKQLPPPSRGLPCFGAAPSAFVQGHTSVPLSSALPRRHQLANGSIKPRNLVPPSHSYLPKPKNH